MPHHNLTFDILFIDKNFKQSFIIDKIEQLTQLKHNGNMEVFRRNILMDQIISNMLKNT